MLNRRDDWVVKASEWLEIARRTKRAYEMEKEANEVHEARKRQMEAKESSSSAPAKKMRLTRDAKSKEKHPGSLTVTMGETCTLMEICTQPSWSKVKMLDGVSKGAVGLVPTFKLEEVKEPEQAMAEETMLEASDSEAEAEAVADSAAAEEEAQLEAADDMEREEMINQMNDDKARPSLELVATELARVLEDLGPGEGFDIHDFMEGEAVSSYSQDHLESALATLAAKVPPLVMIDESNYPPYTRP